MGRKSREKRERKAAEKIPAKWGNDTPYEPQNRNYPAQPEASKGSTHAERHLARLCRQTFLSSWSYPNVFRAERTPRGNTISKEVCDLLVLFEEHVLIFSDKDCAFPESPNLHLNWTRWYRKAIARSASQLHGAERIIRTRAPLFLDPSLKVPFPLPLPDDATMRVHRILVAHGASAPCKAALGGSGTLMIRPSLVANDHTRPPDAGGMPFTLGRVDSGSYIHVLDDTSLDLLLRFLDTASDLIGYLTKKEELILSGRLEFAMGEEALLGLYMADSSPEGEHVFSLPSGDPVALNESWWTKYLASPEAAAKHDADRISYLWDSLIERFATNFRRGTAEHLSHATPADHARVLRFFARESRLQRRILAKNIMDILETTEPHRRRLRVMPPMRPGDPYWVLLAFPYLRTATAEQNRRTRRDYLSACAMVTKLTNPGALDIVGFATESGNFRSRSEDAIYMDAREWTADMQAEARRLQQKHGILTHANVIEWTEDEYPVDARR